MTNRSGLPDGFHTLTANAIVKNVSDAVAFYIKAFGAEEVFRLTAPDGTTVHCELMLGDSHLNLGEAMDGWPEHSLLAQLYVADSDAVVARAIEAGATELSPVSDTFFGSREGRIKDPFGNTWTIGTHKETVSHSEMQRRLDEMYRA